MTTVYTLRSGEEVPIGVECAFPLPGLVKAKEPATRPWIQKLGWCTVGALLVLAAQIPPDGVLPEHPPLNGVARVPAPGFPVPPNPLP